MAETTTSTASGEVTTGDRLAILRLEEHINTLKRNLIDAARDVAVHGKLKINAIKYYRAATGATLLEAKTFVESLAPSPNFEDARMQRLEDRVSMLERNQNNTSNVVRI